MLKETRTLSSYEKMLGQAITLLERRGFREFRADSGKFESPSQFTSRDDETVFMPDLMATKNGATTIFEISQKTSEVTRLVSKWALLAQIAKAKGNFFTILVPKGQMKFTQEIMENYQIQAEIIRLE